MTWEEIAPGVWRDPEPIDPDKAQALMAERLAARRTPTQAARRGRSTRLRGAHATALLWAAWLLLVIAFVTWRALT